MKRLLLLATVLVGCPEQFGQQCRSGTVPIGQFNLARQGIHGAGECIGLQADGGLGPITPDDGGIVAATLCYGSGGSDGGPQLQLIVPPSKDTRSSDLLPDGGFRFLGSSTPVVGTACDSADGGGCPVAIDEVFSGNLQTGGDAGFAVQPDGGIPIVTSLTGVLVDKLSSTNTASCVCTLPCTATYAITGTRF
jgi:hypothetical protein